MPPISLMMRPAATGRTRHGVQVELRRTVVVLWPHISSDEGVRAVVCPVGPPSAGACSSPAARENDVGPSAPTAACRRTSRVARSPPTSQVPATPRLTDGGGSSGRTGGALGG